MDFFGIVPGDEVPALVIRPPTPPLGVKGTPQHQGPGHEIRMPSFCLFCLAPQGPNHLAMRWLLGDFASSWNHRLARLRVYKASGPTAASEQALMAHDETTGTGLPSHKHTDSLRNRSAGDVFFDVTFRQGGQRS